MEQKIYRKLKQNIKEVRRKIGPKCKEAVESILKEIDSNIFMLYKIVIRDPKTGLYNSRFFNALFEIEFEKAKRGQKLSIMVIDIDNLKQVNDKNGHKKGDDILKRVSYLIKENIRKSDIPSRFGGDEFVILLPYAPLNKAIEIGKRLKEKIMKDKILSRYDATVSAGVADFEKGDTTNKFFNKADFALLCAKKQGKNILMSYKDI